MSAVGGVQQPWAGSIQGRGMLSVCLSAHALLRRGWMDVNRIRATHRPEQIFVTRDFMYGK